MASGTCNSGPVAAVALANRRSLQRRRGTWCRGARNHGCAAPPGPGAGATGPGAVQGLNLGLLVHAQDQRPVGDQGRDPQCPDLFDEEGVRRQLEGFRLQCEGAPDDRGVAQTGTPMDRAAWRPWVWTRQRNHPFHVFIRLAVGRCGARPTGRPIAVPRRERHFPTVSSDRRQPLRCCCGLRRRPESFWPAAPGPAPSWGDEPTVPAFPFRCRPNPSSRQGVRKNTGRTFQYTTLVLQQRFSKRRNG